MFHHLSRSEQQWPPPEADKTYRGLNDIHGGPKIGFKIIQSIGHLHFTLSSYKVSSLSYTLAMQQVKVDGWSLVFFMPWGCMLGI